MPFVMHQFCEPGEAWSGTFEHYLVSITVQGGACYRGPYGEVDVEAGDLLCFAPGAWQNWVATVDGWTVYYLIIDIPLPMQALLPPENLASGIARVSLPVQIEERVRTAFAEMLTWGERRAVMSARLVLNRLEYALLLIRDVFPPEMVDERIERARRFLHDRLETPTTLDDVTRTAYLSKSRLCGLFKDITGSSPLQYLEDLRMNRAGQLLTFSSLTVDEIAERLCYSDRKYFDKRFKRHWQVTPYRYRRHANERVKA